MVFIFSVFYFVFFASNSFAQTTQFRSANIVTTDGSPSYIDLNNCSVTDSNTCNREIGSSYGNLYFRDFGNYSDFGIPEGSKITKVRIKVTGKTTAGTYIGLSSGTTFQSNCQSPSDLWVLNQLIGSVINTQNFVTNVTEKGSAQTVTADCLQVLNFENKKFIFRINYSSGQNWSSSIDNFEIAFDYDSPVTPTPTSTPTPTPTLVPTPTLTSTPSPIPTPAKTPLILIPGIAGSELKTTEMTIWNEDNGHGGIFTNIYPAEKVWVNNIEAVKLGNDDYFDILKMFDDGKTSQANLALTGNLFDGYQETISFFVSNGYTLNKDFFLFPYDWRRDIALSSPLLDQKINEIKTQTGSTKVDIIAHSMGGLVARNYISDTAKAKNVRKLFTLGTPHLGAVESLKNIVYGGCLTKLSFVAPFICLGVASAEVKDVLQNMISGYELAPSREYFNFYNNGDKDHPYPYQDNDKTLNYDETKSLLTSKSHNTSLFTPAEAFHSLDKSLTNTNGVEITNIAGSGRPTLGQIREKNNKKDGFTINGDETVPLFSASLNDSGKNKSLLGDAQVFYTKQEHGGLVGSGPALNLVKNILVNSNQLPVGVSTKPYILSGNQISVHSPVNIHVYDSLNNHTGYTSDGNFETNIPGSSYSFLDDAKFVFLPDNGNYNIKFEATDQGKFDFKIRKFENDTVSQEILYTDIPLTIATKAETKFDTSSNQSPIVYLDKDGNGTIDQEINPSVNQAPTSTPTPTPTPTTAPTSTPTPTSTLTPTPAQIPTLTRTPEQIFEKSVLSSKDIDIENINYKKEKEKQDMLAVLVLSMTIWPQLFNHLTRCVSCWLAQHL